MARLINYLNLRNAALLLGFSLGIAQTPTIAYCQVLAGTDDLGRVLLQNDKVGDVKADKQVAMFYFLWHEKAPSTYWDLSEIIQKYSKTLIIRIGVEEEWAGCFSQR